MELGSIGSRPPRVVRSGVEAREAVRAAQRAGQRVGLVPTMGALHEGHVSLVEAARRECQFTVATIFVNPTQFGPQEDFARYPRTWDDDLAALARVGADLVFAPEVAEMYPPNCTTAIEPPRVAMPLEGHCRPGHFRGVATIVMKLFQLLPADAAYFGQKDYQQTLVVRRMVEDLNVPLDIVVCPTLRDADGLALSSRNRYLSAPERHQALAIIRGLRQALEMVRQGERSASVLHDAIHARLLDAAIQAIDYVAIVDPESLENVEVLAGPAMALVACRVGATRLIDNLALE
jgi:pantoate--beta-alanine ligase